MRVENIVMRQEIRQMLNEVGINKDTLRDMTKEVLREEIGKQIKKVGNIGDMVTLMVRNKVSDRMPYDFNHLLREVIKEEIRNLMDVKVDVSATVKPKES